MIYQKNNLIMNKNKKLTIYKYENIKVSYFYTK